MERSEAIHHLREVANDIRHGTHKYYAAPQIEADLIDEAADLLCGEDPKARYDRYVCAVAQSDVHGALSEGDIAEQALNIMLAADKRWEEYTKQQTEEVK